MQNTLTSFRFSFIFLLVSTFTYGQNYPTVKYPFDLSILERFAQFKSDTLPKYHKGKFYFVNRKTGKKIFKTGYDVAYPFAKKLSLIRYSNYIRLIGQNNKIIQDSILEYKIGNLEEYNYGEIAIGTIGKNWNDKYLIYNTFTSKVEKIDIYEYNSFGSRNGGCHYPGKQMQAYAYLGENGKYGIKDRNGSIILNPELDKVFWNRGDFIGQRNSKIGVVFEDASKNIPFVYDEVILRTYQSPYGNSALDNVIGLKKDSLWEYFDRTNGYKFLMRSKYKCKLITGYGFNNNAIGIFEENNKYNILFKDGTTLGNSYDWISGNGLIAIEGKNVYIIDEDKSRFLYYKEQ